MSDLAVTLRTRLASSPELGAMVVPGVFNALSALTAVQAGFEAIYVSGAGVTNSYLGLPDLGFLGLAELSAHTAAIAEAVPHVPIIVDGDTGFGNALGVARAVTRLERCGATAIQIEDQVNPKRCGHFGGSQIQIVPLEEMLNKIRAALDARDTALIVARTDARDGHGIDVAIERGRAYADAGADVVFVEAPRTIAELEAVGRATYGVPLIANMVEGGLTPVLGITELSRLGFSAALYANSALRASIKSMTHVLTTLRRDGTTLAAEDAIASWQDRQELVRKSHFDAMAVRYGDPEETTFDTSDHK